VTVRPIFLLSQPRAGSTLVQRVLGSYDEVSTVSEPWILLPLLSALRDGGIRSQYPHWLAHVAIRDFADGLPGGMGQVREELREAALRLYGAAAAPGARYFLDKTPSYHVIAPLLQEVFPDAKFIYLWRNPLAVLASILETWGEGRFVPHRFRVDLFSAVETLTSSYESGGDVLGVRYEDLLGSDDGEWRRITDHLGLVWDPSTLVRFSRERLAGRMGDPTGVERYSAVSAEPLEKWRSTLANPVRKHWARRYLRWIGERRLAVMGYDLGELQRMLDSVPSRSAGAIADITALAPSLVTEPVRSRILGDADGSNVWRMLYGGAGAQPAPRDRRRIPEPVAQSAASSNGAGPPAVVSGRPAPSSDPRPGPGS
jgi:hypothetical protein